MPRYRKDYPRIRLIRFNCWERPLRAIVSTKYGIVKVWWQENSGTRYWTASGDPKAQVEARGAIDHIETIGESMH
ncbi:MAG: hypothetical protein ABI254_01070 [Chthoniobacterales bacterium]